MVIPVELTVVAQGPPVAAAGGVVNNGTFASGEPLAQGDIAAVFGNQFDFDAPQSAASLPLQTTLDNVQVTGERQSRSRSTTSLQSQINFEVPIDAATGDGTVQVVRNGTAGNLIYVDINAQAPRFIVIRRRLRHHDDAGGGIDRHSIESRKGWRHHRDLRPGPRANFARRSLRNRFAVHHRWPLCREPRRCASVLRRRSSRRLAPRPRLSG